MKLSPQGRRKYEARELRLQMADFEDMLPCELEMLTSIRKWVEDERAKGRSEAEISEMIQIVQTEMRVKATLEGTSAYQMPS